MAWLQNLAGKAEDLLNKVDQNAARVLNEPIGLAVSEDHLNIANEIPKELMNSTSELNSSVQIDLDGTGLEQSLTDDFREDASDPNDSSSNGAFEKIKSMTDSVGLISVSSENSTNIDLPEATQVKLEAQIAQLEAENEELSKQILNQQHAHSGLQHEHANTQTQLQRANEMAQQAIDEMQEYRARAKRLLEAKEKVLPLQHSDNTNALEVQQFNMEMKNALEMEIRKNMNLETKVGAISKELATLQHQYLTAQKENQRNIDALRMNVVSERRTREDIEEENRLLSKDLKRANKALQESKTLEGNHRLRVSVLEDQLKTRMHHPPHDSEMQLQVVNHTLMQKQLAMDTLMGEVNALKIQLEKAEQKFMLKCVQTASRPMEIAKDYEDGMTTRIPRLLQVSALDAGMTQRVKHAYSTLDTFSIRTGVFLRRYPLARIFLICYMMLLHLWVLFVLLIYVPGSH